MQQKDETLTINQLGDFTNQEIQKYKDTTKVLIIGQGIQEIPDKSFQEWPALNYVRITGTVKTIGASFISCIQLTTIVLDEGIKTIGTSFSFCSITELTIPNSVETIGVYAFINCTKLEKLILGTGIRNIGQNSFNHCHKLKCIYFYGESEPNIDQSAFYDIAARHVMTDSSYKGTSFGALTASTEGADGCIPIVKTQTISNTKTNSPINTKTISNTISESKSQIQTNTFSNTITHTEQNTKTQTNSYTQTNTFDFTNESSNVSNELIEKENNNFNKWIIVGAVCGGIAAVVAITVATILIRNRIKIKRKKLQNKMMLNKENGFQSKKFFIL